MSAVGYFSRTGSVHSTSGLPFPWRSPPGVKIVMGDLRANKPEKNEIEGTETGKRLAMRSTMPYHR